MEVLQDIHDLGRIPGQGGILNGLVELGFRDAPSQARPLGTGGFLGKEFPDRVHEKLGSECLPITRRSIRSCISTTIRSSGRFLECSGKARYSVLVCFHLSTKVGDLALQIHSLCFH